MKRAAVIGDPIGQSLSPAIFSFLSRHCGFNDFQYEALRVTPDHLADFVKQARKSFIGLNVTLPHKEKIKGHLDSLSPEAKAIGAINVVKFENGQAEGHNTDVQGLIDTFSENGIILDGKRVLIFGAGGAARAVCYVCGKFRAKEVVIWNKTLSRAEAVAGDFRIIFPNTSFKASQNLDKNSFSLKHSQLE